MVRPQKSWLSNEKFKNSYKTKLSNHLEGLKLMKGIMREKGCL